MPAVSSWTASYVRFFNSAMNVTRAVTSQGGDSRIRSGERLRISAMVRISSAALAAKTVQAVTTIHPGSLIAGASRNRSAVQENPVGPPYASPHTHSRYGIRAAFVSRSLRCRGAPPACDDNPSP